VTGPGIAETRDEQQSLEELAHKLKQSLAMHSAAK
jgi:hypothetical protein